MVFSAPLESFEVAHVALVAGELVAVLVALLVLSRVLLLEERKSFAGLPRVHRRVELRVVERVQQSGAAVIRIAAEELCPVAIRAVVALELLALRDMHAVLPDDLEHQRIPTSPRTESMSFCGS